MSVLIGPEVVERQELQLYWLLVHLQMFQLLMLMVCPCATVLLRHRRVVAASDSEPSFQLQPARVKVKAGVFGQDQQQRHYY
jgi:hypothetical protein